MIQTQSDITFAFNSGADTRTLRCDVIFGQKIEGATDERLDRLLYDIHSGRRRTLRCRNFFLTAEDCFWLASFIKAADKTIAVSISETYNVVNDKSNLDKIFDLVNGLNSRASLELKFDKKELSLS